MERRSLMFVFILVVLTLTPHKVDALRCFECTDTPHPADCPTITTCSVDQNCVLNQYITTGGLLLYSSGCLSASICTVTGKRDAGGKLSNGENLHALSRRSDVQICQECCDKEFCNNYGCGTVALSQPQRGPYCFSCPVLLDPTACRTIKACNPGETCILREVSSSGASGHRVYTSDCALLVDCGTGTGMTAVGKRGNPVLHKQRNICHSCCHTDFCNDNCDVTVTQRPVTQAFTTSVPKPSTAAASLITTTTMTTQAATSSNTQAQCGHNGYTYVANSVLCFKFHFESETWTSANRVCQHEGGTLAVIDNRQKWSYLKSQVQHETRFDDNRIFIGLSDPNQNDTLYWADGSPLGQFSKWGHGEPDEGGDNCVYLDTHDSCLWHDTHCTHAYPFICSKQI